MLLLHLSDLHLSRYGEHRTWSQPPAEEAGWLVLHEWQRWKIEGKRDRRGRNERLRVVDPDGVIHVERAWPSRSDDKIVTQLIALAMERHTTSAEALVKERPFGDDLSNLLRLDRANTNLRFLQVVDELLRLEPSAIAITGDMTDNGFGYGLIESYLSAWIASDRCFVVPGNHDLYDQIPNKSRRVRLAAKREGYLEFATAAGCKPLSHGAYVRYMEDVAIVGLSSCKRPLNPLSASGEVTREQLVWLSQLGEDRKFRGCRLRLCLLHHHLLRMPFILGRRNPIEMGMRLRNAPEVMRTCTQAGIDAILNGHRHHGYVVQLAGQPIVLSSPSSTLGCKSTHLRYLWSIDLSRDLPFPELRRISDEPAEFEEEMDESDDLIEEA